MAYERFGKEHLALTSVIERYFGADAGYLDISCLDVARAVLQAGWTKHVLCKDCIHYDNSEGICWCKLNSKFFPGGMDWHGFPEDGFCSYGERREDNGVR